MKAAVYTKYGPPDVLQVKEVPKPVPKDHEVLIQVHASTVSAADYRMRGFDVAPGLWLPFRVFAGIKGPKKKILGAELAGEVVEAGRDVTLFQRGDPVFGYSGASYGAYAEYMCMPEGGALAIKPAGLTFQEAAAVPHGALAALYFLRDKGKIRRGEKVLVYGASGAVGTAAVQLARHFGARVTGVCSTANLELVHSLGADRVIDYTREDFTESEETYDIIFDTVGRTSFSRSRSSLGKNGRYLLTTFDVPQLLQMLLTSLAGGRKVICAVAPERKEDLLFIGELLESGELKPVIDREYPLERIVEAHRYAEGGRKTGSVVVNISGPGS